MMAGQYGVSIALNENEEGRIKCLLCHTNTSPRQRRDICGPTFGCISQLEQVLGRNINKNQGLGCNFVCLSCYVKLNKLCKIEDDIATKIQKLKDERFSVLAQLRLKHVSGDGSPSHHRPELSLPDESLASVQYPIAGMPSQCPFQKETEGRQSVTATIAQPQTSSTQVLSTPSKGWLASMVLNAFNHLQSAVQQIIGQVLDHGGATDELIYEQFYKTSSLGDIGTLVQLIYEQFYKTSSLGDIGTLVQLIYEQFYKTSSLGDIGALVQPRNVLSRVAVHGPDEVIGKYRSHLTFVDDCLDGFIVGAAMQLLNMEHTGSEPQRQQTLFDALSKEDRYKFIHRIADGICQSW
ncbi:uncharacterized protein [Haliotis asinina]|uniref:uncharacterized protein n=1 Tax=Haliotis asinina TaxID=109174 RepID=UPI003531EDDC